MPRTAVGLDLIAGAEGVHQLRPRRWPGSCATRRSWPASPNSFELLGRSRRAHHTRRAARTNPRRPLFRRHAESAAYPTHDRNHRAPDAAPASRARLVERAHCRPHRPQAVDPGQRLLDPDGHPRRVLLSPRAGARFLTITHFGNIDAVHKISQALDVLPQKAQEQIKGSSDCRSRVVRACGLSLRTDGGRRAAHDLDRGRCGNHRRRTRTRYRRVPGPLPRRCPGDLPRQADRFD